MTLNGRISKLGVLLLTAGIATATSVAAQPNEGEVLRQRLESLSSSPNPAIDGTPIAAIRLITELYERRRYEPAWTDPTMVQQLLDQVRASAEHGLNPADYHARQLGARARAGVGAMDAAHRADTEILCVDALVRLAVSLRFGKLDPAGLDPAWNFSRRIKAEDPVDVFNRILNEKDVAAALEEAGPDTLFYKWLRRALATHRDIQAGGGWPAVLDGDVLKRGSSGPRVATLQARLERTGDLPASGSVDPAVFDETLENGVKRFQERHGIRADGKVGPRSLAELNTPVEARIEQIRATLERVRWVFRDAPTDYLIVDVAGFQAHLVKEGKPIWTTRVQIGKPYHATPVFKDTMLYLEFNPTWTIPPGILRNETLPKIRKDPSYLSQRNMSVVTHAGEIVDPSTVDWAATARGGFPHMIRQEPGPDNALGRIKFIFPNKHMVYLHDTPSKGLFARSERAFSHGCIRTQDPFALATLLLEDQGWDRVRIDQVVASKKTTRINLEEPLSVMLLYWMAEADENGRVSFRRDLHDRDAPIIRGLDEPLEVHPPKRARGAVDGS